VLRRLRLQLVGLQWHQRLPVGRRRPA
jgi:hypothetical protein